MTSGTAGMNAGSGDGVGRAGPRPGDGSASAGDVLASEAAACASRSFEVQQLAARVVACADRTDAELARLAGIELQGWQSPAGRAYRTALSLQAASLRRSGMALQDAAAAVLRHANNVALSSAKPGY